MWIIKSYLTNSDCYKKNRKIKVKGLMLHSVGTPQPEAGPFIKRWNQPGKKACAHAIIEPGGKVYQLLPWNHYGWHAGGSANGSYIGVEMTEPKTIQYTSGAYWKETGDGKATKKHVKNTYQVAVELFAYLCKQYNLNPKKAGVIVSHSEGHKRGIASNHGDVEHIWKKFGLTMNQFRKDVAAEMKEKKKIAKKATAGKTLKYGVLKQEMNIRTGADTKKKIITKYPAGTLVEIKQVTGNEWYKITCKESPTGYGFVSNVKSEFIATGSKTYTVKKKDTLWSIAKKQLGNGKYYTKIRDLNQLDKKPMKVGMKIILP